MKKQKNNGTLSMGPKSKCLAVATMAFGLSLAMTAPTLGAPTWDGGGGDGLWNTATNWDTDLLPAGGDTNIANGDSVTLSGTAGDVNFLNVNGGSTLTITADLDMGNDLQINSGGVVTLNAGTIDISGDKVKIGESSAGSFFMTGGTVNLGDDLELYSGSLLEYSGGSFNLDVELEARGGTLRMVGYDAAGNLTINGMKDTSSSSIFEFIPTVGGLITPITNNSDSDGVGLVVNLDALTASASMTLFLAGSAQSAFNSILITKGGDTLNAGAGPNEYQLSYAGGTGGNDVVLSYTAAAIPEPGTMTLLALGGLGVLLMRRRRCRS